jgi:putative peptidoglycan lipid II flippase
MWHQLKNLYKSKQSTLYASTIVVALTLFVARILGLVKLRVLTGYFDKSQLDLFFAAFRLPDFIFEVFVAGSISSCFIPIISEIVDKKKNGKDEIMIFSQSLSLIFLFSWIIIFLVMKIFAKNIVEILVPGYTAAQVNMVSSMSLTILFYQVPFLLLGNVLSAILQTEKQFLIPGIAPAFYNLGIIAGVILFAQKHGLYGALYGVGIGSVLYFITLFLGVYILGYPIKIKIYLFDKKIKRFFNLFWPRFFNSLTAQVDATVDLALSTLRGVGSYSSFYLARNLQILPVSFFGIAVSQTALPFFSRLYHQNKKEELMQLLVKFVLQITFIMMPFVIFFTALRVPIVRLFFGGDKFDLLATQRTANVLSIFALSLPFHTVYYLITRAYFAIQDTKTPFVTGVIFTLSNTLLSIIFIKVLNLPVYFLALSFTTSITLNTAVLFYLLVKKLDSVKIVPVLGKFLLMGLNTIATTFVVWVSLKLLDGLVFDTGRTINLFILTMICVFIGSMVYLYLSWIFVPAELKSVLSLVYRFSFFKKTISKYKEIFYTGKTDIPLEDKQEQKL